MKTIHPSSALYLAESKIKNAGRGVFAARDITKNEVVEICPILEVHIEDVFVLQESIMMTYYFSFDDAKDMVNIALGYGSIYNHSYNPNATYKKDSKEKVLEFKAIKAIKKDEEITVNYNHGDPNNKEPLWEDIPTFELQSDS